MNEIKISETVAVISGCKSIIFIIVVWVPNIPFLLRVILSLAYLVLLAILIVQIVREHKVKRS